MLQHLLNLILMSLYCVIPVSAVVMCTPQVLFAQDDDATDEEAKEDPNSPENLKKSSPLLQEPKSPGELLEAVILLVDFARPKLAKVYLDELKASDLDDAALLKLRDKHGAALFLKLARIKQLQPTSTELLMKINAAFRKSGADPKRVDNLIDKLEGSLKERDVAINALSSAGTVVVPRLLNRFSISDNDQSRDQILEAMVKMGSPVVPALVAAVQSPDKRIRLASIEVLGRVGDRSALDYLWFPAYSKAENAQVRETSRTAINRILRLKTEESKPPLPSQIANELKRLALVHYQNKYNWKIDDTRGDDLVSYWEWNRKKNQLAVEYVSGELASKQTGIIFAKEAFQLLPENKELQSLYLGMALALDISGNEKGAGATIGTGSAMTTALTTGEDVVSKTLTQALKYQRPDIAELSLQALSQIGSRAQLSMPTGKQSPIVAALNYPDRRVQFAAATTVLQLDPQKPFRGSTRVVSILTRALRNEGVPAAIVIHPHSEISVSIASLMREVGFNAGTAKTGSEGFTLATKRDDIELILVDANVARWGLSQTISNIRADARTAYIPIVVFGPDSLKAKILRTYGQVPLVTYIDKPASVEQLNRQLKPFLDKIKTPAPTPKQRSARIEFAAYWLAHIANGQRTTIFDIKPAQDALLDSLGDVQLFENAMQALSVIPNKKVQQQFQKISTNTIQKKTERESATLQLAYHIQRFGLLLNTKEVSEIKAAWKNTAADVELSTAFATLVGTLKPDSKRVGERLKNIVPVKPSAQ